MDNLTKKLAGAVLGFAAVVLMTGQASANIVWGDAIPERHAVANIVWGTAIPERHAVNATGQRQDAVAKKANRHAETKVLDLNEGF